MCGSFDAKLELANLGGRASVAQRDKYGEMLMSHLEMHRSIRAANNAMAAKIEPAIADLRAAAADLREVAEAILAKKLLDEGKESTKLLGKTLPPDAQLATLERAFEKLSTVLTVLGDDAGQICPEKVG